MVFHSVQYLLFLSVCVVAYHAIPPRARWTLLLASSWTFFASWRPESLVVLLALTGSQYAFALWMGREPVKTRRRPYLLASLVVAIGFLACFKYANATQLISLRLFGAAQTGSATTGALVPIGISFYTLLTIGYMLDVYHGRRSPERHVGIFAVFASYFPVAVAGPIERAGHLLPQLRPTDRVALYEHLSAGVKLIIWGFFLKLVIADRAALYVDAVYSHPDKHSGATFLLATIFYSFQVYCDFSGYSSVAIGSARLMGIEISPNFNHPYLASSVKEFWRRWHITLSNWLRDYVFLPLAYGLSSRLTEDRYARLKVDTVVYVIAILVTFALCGLWHGASVTFVIWGVLHGVYLAAEHARRRRRWHTAVRVATTYALVLVSWVFFRSDNVATAFGILGKMATLRGPLFVPHGPDVVAPIYAMVGIALLMAVEMKREFYRGSFTVFRHPNEYVRVVAYSVVVALTILIGVFDGGQFIYAQF